jgi:hypothetical protein
MEDLSYLLETRAYLLEDIEAEQIQDENSLCIKMGAKMRGVTPEEYKELRVSELKKELAEIDEKIKNQRG